MLKNLENYIAGLRSKPEIVRKRIALFSSLGFTVLIFVFWMASYGIKTKVIASNVEIKSPVSSMTASVGNAVTGVFKYAKDIVFGASKTEYSASDIIEIIPGDK